jgi:hypothetical protein
MGNETVTNPGVVNPESMTIEMAIVLRKERPLDSAMRASLL